MLDELMAPERSAIVAWYVTKYGRISNARVRALTGLSRGGARHLLCRISRLIPIYYDEKSHNWHILL